MKRKHVVVATGRDGNILYTVALCRRSGKEKGFHL